MGRPSAWAPRPTGCGGRKFACRSSTSLQVGAIRSSTGSSTSSIWSVLAGAVVDGAVQLGLLVAAGQYMLQLGAPVGNALSDVSRMQVAAGAARRVFAFLDSGPEPQATSTPDGPARRLNTAEVRRGRHVSFAYADGDPVLRDVSFRADPGQKPSRWSVPAARARRRSPVILLRFYEPTSGRIRIDGSDIADIDASAVRARLGVVFQDPVLFDGSIEQNIRLGRDEISSERLVEAATIANAHDFITATEDGYDTHVGERGLRLSGGQIQRVAIARAILGDPRILILDEATSSLDAESERLVQEALARAARGRTTIVIAHRLATVRRADSDRGARRRPRARFRPARGALRALRPLPATLRFAVPPTRHHCGVDQRLDLPGRCRCD